MSDYTAAEICQKCGVVRPCFAHDGPTAAAAPAPEGLDGYEMAIEEFKSQAWCQGIRPVLTGNNPDDLIAEILRARPALSDETLREMADEWQADIKQDCELGYLGSGLMAFARAVLARQQEGK